MTTAPAILGRLTAAKLPPRPRRLVRPPLPVRPDAIERSYRRSLRAILRYADRLLRETAIPTLPQVTAAAEASRPKNDAWHEDDYGDLIRRLLEALRSSWFGVVSDRYLDSLLSGLAKDVSAHQRRQHRRIIKAVLGVDVISAEPWLEAELRAFVTENVGLIKTVATSYFADIEKIVFSGVRAGLRHEAIASQLKSQLPRRYRARFDLIARDQVNKLNGQLTMLRQKDAGVTRYVWRTVRDTRVRASHVAMDGKICRWDKPPIVDGAPAHPGHAIQCFPGSTRISRTDGVKKFFRRVYPGKLAFIVTDNGVRLSATPNHPILTSSGWKPMQMVNVGDYVFDAPGQGPLGIETKEERSYVTLEEAFRFFQIMGPVGRQTCGTTEQFHGDGSDEDVDIISADCGLLNDEESAIFQLLGQEILAEADVRLSALPCRGGPHEVLRAWGFPPNGIVRGFGKLLSLAGREAGHPDDVCLATAAWLNSRINDMSPYYSPGDLVFERQRQLAGAGGILRGNPILRQLYTVACRSVSAIDQDAPSAEKLAQLVDVQQPEALADLVQSHIGTLVKPLRVIDRGLCKLPWGAHVYNLETIRGWYIAEGLIVGNCRCYGEPILEDIIP